MGRYQLKLNKSGFFGNNDISCIAFMLFISISTPWDVAWAHGGMKVSQTLVCPVWSHNKTRSDWLILKDYSPVVHTGRLKKIYCFLWIFHVSKNFSGWKRGVRLSTLILNSVAPDELQFQKNSALAELRLSRCQTKETDKKSPVFLFFFLFFFFCFFCVFLLLLLLLLLL